MENQKIEKLLPNQNKNTESLNGKRLFTINELFKIIQILKKNTSSFNKDDLSIQTKTWEKLNINDEYTKNEELIYEQLSKIQNVNKYSESCILQKVQHQDINEQDKIFLEQFSYRLKTFGPKHNND